MLNDSKGNVRQSENRSEGGSKSAKESVDTDRLKGTVGVHS